MKLIFQGEKDGYNLKNILQLEEAYSKVSNILFLIETNEDEKFGFAMNRLTMHTDNKFYRPNTSILISIKPQLKTYSPNNDCDEIIYIDTKTLIFGNGPNGPAIHLDNNLVEGDSYEGGCFNNPSLVGTNNHFKIKKIEIYKLE